MKKIILSVCIAITSLSALADEMSFEQRVAAMNCISGGQEDCAAAGANAPTDKDSATASATDSQRPAVATGSQGDKKQAQVARAKAKATTTRHAAL